MCLFKFPRLFLVAIVTVVLMTSSTILRAQVPFGLSARPLTPIQQLLAAITAYDLPHVTALLNADPTLINKQDSMGQLPLIAAIEAYYYYQPASQQILRRLINKSSSNKPDFLGKTPLQLVINSARNNFDEDHQIEFAGLLLDAGADLKAKDWEGKSAIHLAVLSNHPRLLGLMLDRGADINARTSTGDTPLHLAADNFHLEMVKMLIARKANLNPRNDRGQTPLHIAVYNEALEVVKMLLDAGADVNVLTNRGESAIHFAMRLGVLYTPFEDINRIDNRPPNPPRNQRQPFLEMLLDKGACADIQDQFGLTPMLFALINRDVVNHDTLLQHKIPIDRLTALFNAVAMDNVGSVNRLLKANRDNAFLRAPTGTTALHIAALWNAVNVVPLLLKSGISPDSRDAFGQTPLHYACSDSENGPVVAVLLKAGADPNLESDYQETPLHLAVRALSGPMVRLLLTYHASPNRQDHVGETPLHIACNFVSGSVDAPPFSFGQVIAGFLLEAGADPNRIDFTGRVPLSFSLPPSMIRLLLKHHASPNNAYRISPLETVLEPYPRFPIMERARLLLDAGANPNVLTSSRITLLDGAIRQGKLPLATLLIERGADVNFISPDTESSPLLDAVKLQSVRQSDKVQIVKLLLTKGADVNFQDHYGHTLLYFYASDEKIATLLRQYGTK
jgi:ankyrin repeat protein